MLRNIGCALFAMIFPPPPTELLRCTFYSVRSFANWSLFARAERSVSKVCLRACSHEPGTVNYPGVMIAQGQALPRVHMMICCPRATLPRVNFIAPGQVHRHLITTNLSEFL